MTTTTLARPTSIKCGFCKGRHGSVALVRKCYAGNTSKVKVLVEVPAAVPVRNRLDFSTISNGNYAVQIDGVIKFYRVHTSKKGFKNVQVRASDSLHPVPFRAGIAILHRIVEAGLTESQMLFASELGCCYVCGRTLTDETSRKLGIGPVCRGE